MLQYSQTVKFGMAVKIHKLQLQKTAWSSFHKHDVKKSDLHMNFKIRHHDLGDKRQNGGYQ